MFVAATGAARAPLHGPLPGARASARFASPLAAVGTQSLGNAVVGMVAFSVIEGLPGRDGAPPSVAPAQAMSRTLLV